jgi:two-component system, OmpR family, response regulator QseB
MLRVAGRPRNPECESLKLTYREHSDGAEEFLKIRRLAFIHGAFRPLEGPRACFAQATVRACAARLLRVKIYLIEDDLNIGQALLTVFKEEGHEVVWVRMANDAVQRLQAEDFDAVLLDLGLPDGDGNELLRSLRAAGLTVPVLIITARDGLQDRLKGFDNGADDYLIKPFEIPELLVRLRAILRRSGVHGEAEALWSFGNLVLEEKRMRVTLDGSPVTLSKTEYALLLTLMKQSDRVLTRAELERRVLPFSDGATLDVHISNLRKKIGDGHIRTVRGVGYMMQGHRAG